MKIQVLKGQGKEFTAMDGMDAAEISYFERRHASSLSPSLTASIAAQISAPAASAPGARFNANPGASR